MDLGLRGKKAIVTGATKGIGRAIVELLASEGADVGLCARTADEVETTVQALRQRGVNVVGEAVNVRDGEAYKAWLERTAQSLGGCDIFIPNVSAGGGFDSEKNWVKNFEVDVLHTVRGCETLMPHLEKSGSGSIVIISSTNALETFGVPQAFNAMKAALITYAKQLSQHVGKRGVRVNSISPGPIYFEGGAWELIKGTMAKLFEYALRQIPTGRMGTPEEVARIVAFVASPAGSLITGSNIVADNGFTKRVQF
ncbi:MAG: SDR family oxidoreductase [Sinobacteraceae bacterium]|nr:SDR family oxidoreductase [Nevskiaceae bacterium]MBV9911397.1 SDR family oxidoreductase [Nevskiaceae bacterium]